MDLQQLRTFSEAENFRKNHHNRNNHTWLFDSAKGQWVCEFFMAILKQPSPKPKKATIYVSREDYKKFEKISEHMSCMLKRKITASEVANLIFQHGIDNEEELAKVIAKIKRKEAVTPCQTTC